MSRTEGNLLVMCLCRESSTLWHSPGRARGGRGRDALVGDLGVSGSRTCPPCRTGREVGEGSEDLEDAARVLGAEEVA
jgi:hypothetical protein